MDSLLICLGLGARIKAFGNPVNPNSISGSVFPSNLAVGTKSHVSAMVSVIGTRHASLAGELTGAAASFTARGETLKQLRGIRNQGAAR